MKTNTSTSPNPLIDLIDGIYQREMAGGIDQDHIKQMYQEQQEWKGELEVALKDRCLSDETVKEAFLYLSKLEWEITEDYYDGYRWNTTEYFTLATSFVKSGYASLLREVFTKHHQDFSSLHAVQLAGVLQCHNNKMLATNTVSDSWTDTGFILSCLKHCSPLHLAQFKDHLMEEPDVVAFMFEKITSSQNPDMQEHLNHFTREDFFIEILPGDPYNISDKDQQIALLIRDTIALMEDTSHIVAEAGRRVAEHQKDPQAQQLLLSYYKTWFEKLDIKHFDNYDYEDPFWGEWMDTVVPILPSSVQEHVAFQPSMQQYPFCGTVYVKGKMIEELGERSNPSQKMKKL